ncbi:hypothetical protein [Herpetosiphon geysericola]|uniref:Uncharacterized protein n=1 Tax=Herpetosiphon geysericola TaxID=70996 RepID=A0A0P6XX29_9CHLR|nr:hypothetical protein [Herpetosiphon geysericola]KPL80320.1 hypothetical protein SE18_25085 [Herpetosiphon geysericola]
MQQLILACGVNPLAPIILIFGTAMLLFISNMTIKYFLLAKTHRSKRRSLIIDSLSLTFIEGFVIGLVILSATLLPNVVFMTEIGFLFSYQIIIWALFCIVDTFFIKRWSIQTKFQAIRLDDSQQLQVAPAQRTYLPPWVVAFISNTLILGLIGLLFWIVN